MCMPRRPACNRRDHATRPTARPARLRISSKPHTRGHMPLFAARALRPCPSWRRGCAEHLQLVNGRSRRGACKSECLAPVGCDGCAEFKGRALERSKPRLSVATRRRSGARAGGAPACVESITSHAGPRPSPAHDARAAALALGGVESAHTRGPPPSIAYRPPGAQRQRQSAARRTSTPSRRYITMGSAMTGTPRYVGASSAWPDPTIVAKPACCGAIETGGGRNACMPAQSDTASVGPRVTLARLQDSHNFSGKA